MNGFVRAYFPDRGYGYVRDGLTGFDTFFHRSDFVGDPATIVERARVQYDVVNYIDRKKFARTKAVNVTLVPQPAPINEAQS